MDAIVAIHTRRSVRVYRPQPIPRELIEDVLWAAVQAPSPPASGDTPWALCVIEGAEKIAAYGERAMRHARDYAIDGSPPKWTMKPGFKVFWDAPALILVCARRDNAETPHDCCRAGQNLMLAAHACGLASCWVGAPMPWLCSEGIAEELGLPAEFDPTVAIVLGYAAEKSAGNPRPRPFIHWCGTG